MSGWLREWDGSREQVYKSVGSPISHLNAHSLARSLDRLLVGAATAAARAAKAAN